MAAEETIFHRIIKREIPAQIVYEDDEVLAFRDVNPVATTHILVVPKKTLPSMREAGENDKALLGQLMLVAAEIARKEGIEKSGYRLVVNTGEQALQSVHQLHVHLIGGRIMQWPPG